MRSLRRFVTDDVIAAFALIVLSVAAWLQLTTMPDRAAMFPRLATGLLFLLSVAYLGRELVRRAPLRAAPFFLSPGRFAAALGLAVLYAVIFPRIGFFTATFVFMPVFAATIGMRRHLLTLAASVIFTLGAWIVFVVLLERRLPPERLLERATGLFGG